MREIFRFTVGKIEEGKKVGLATVVERVGSAPRSVGSKMAVSEDGDSMGSVGGGALEAIVEKKLKELMEKGERRQLLDHRMDAKTLEEGMVCGGRAKILLEILEKEDLGIYKDALKKLDEGKGFYLVKKLPPEEGVYISFEKPKDKSAFVDLIEPQERLVIFGGGHISYYLAKMASMCDFLVFVYDNREEYASPQRFPEAQEVCRIDYEKAGDFVKEGDFVVVVTASHLSDKVVLGEVLGKAPYYVGMIGSKRKARKVKETLVEEGVPGSLVELVRSPVGVEIDAETPCEIAVSILAELIKERRRRHVPSN